MQQTLNFAVVCQSLSDSAAHILLALLLAGRGMDVKEIMLWTRIKKRETVYQGLAAMRLAGLIEPQRLAHGRELWLPAGDVLFQMSVKRTPELSTTTTTMEESFKTSEEVVVVAAQESVKRTPAFQMSVKRTSGRNAPQVIHSPMYEANLAMCRKKGIGEPKASYLSDLDHVTPDLIRDHVDDLYESDTIGLAIRRIEGNELPPSWQDELKKIEPRRKEDADDD